MATTRMLTAVGVYFSMLLLYRHHTLGEVQLSFGITAPPNALMAAVISPVSSGNDGTEGASLEPSSPLLSSLQSY